MELLKICVAAFVATRITLLFSQYVSERFGQIFKEPLVLSLILSRIGSNVTLERKKVWEQGFRYLSGLFIVLCYHYIWTHTDIDPTWFSGLIFGIITGLATVGCWYFLFKFSVVSKVRFKEYYLPLFAAYILFALSVIVIYRLFGLFQ
ncbi:hypothetical protein D3C87_61860 [compost metagenome]